MDHSDPVTSDQLFRFANARDDVVDRRRNRRTLVITKPVPLDALSVQLPLEGLAPANTFALKRRGTFEIQQRKLHAAFREFAQIWNDLSLTQRVKHSVVGNEKNARAFKPHRRPPPELCDCRALRRGTATAPNR